MVVKSKTTKTGLAVQLQFIISQHGRYHELMNLIKRFFNCGFIKDRPNQDCVDFCITKYSTVNSETYCKQLPKQEQAP